MANFFTTSFGVSFTDWSEIAVLPSELNGVACNHGWITGCSTGQLNEWFPDFPATAAHLQQLTARLLFAGTSILADPGEQVASFYDLDPGAGLCTDLSFACDLRLITGGQLMIQVATAPGVLTEVTSALGAFIDDGTLNGIQLTFDFTSTSSCRIRVYANNVLVIDHTFVPTNGSASWGVFGGCVSTLGIFGPSAGVRFVSIQPSYTGHGQIRFANVQLDNSINVTNYPNCVGFSPFTSCFSSWPPPAVNNQTCATAQAIDHDVFVDQDYRAAAPPSVVPFCSTTGTLYHGVWYAFTPDQTGTWEIFASANDMAVVAIGPGASNPACPAPICQDFRAGGAPPSLQANLVLGQTYEFLVTSGTDFSNDIHARFYDIFVDKITNDAGVPTAVPGCTCVVTCGPAPPGIPSNPVSPISGGDAVSGSGGVIV